MTIVPRASIRSGAKTCVICMTANTLVSKTLLASAIVDVEGWDRVVDAGVVDEHIETKTVGLGCGSCAGRIAMEVEEVTSRGMAVMPREVSVVSVEVLRAVAKTR